MARLTRLVAAPRRVGIGGGCNTVFLDVVQFGIIQLGVIQLDAVLLRVLTRNILPGEVLGEGARRIFGGEHRIFGCRLRHFITLGSLAQQLLSLIRLIAAFICLDQVEGVSAQRQRRSACRFVQYLIMRRLCLIGGFKVILRLLAGCFIPLTFGVGAHQRVSVVVVRRFRGGTGFGALRKGRSGCCLRYSVRSVVVLLRCRENIVLIPVRGIRSAHV